MKTVTSLLTAIAISSIFSVRSSAEWNLIKLLRDKEEIEPQRVAFVGSASVSQVEGKVERLCGIDRWKAVEKGAQLQVGDIVRTGEGTAVLKMKVSQSFVRVTPNTVVRLVPLQQGWDRAVLTGTEDQNGLVVRACRGAATFREGEGPWRPIVVNTVLSESAQIRTRNDSVVDLYSPGLNRAFRVGGSKEVALTEVLGPRVATPSLAALTQ